MGGAREKRCHAFASGFTQDWIANLRGLGTSNLLRRILGPVVCTTSVAVIVFLASALLMPQAWGVICFYIFSWFLFGSITDPLQT